MKTCINCNISQHPSCFSKGGHGDKRRNTCKTCQKEYRRKYYSENKTRENKNSSKYKKENKDKVNLINSVRHKRTRNNIKLTKLMKEQIKRIYEVCANYRKLGLDFHVDHIAPLKGHNSSGLHAPWNLRITTAKFNMRKGNR